MGKKGFSQVAYLSAKNAQMLANGLKNKGYKILNTDFFNEFVLEVENADDFISKLKQNNIIAGYRLNEKQILVCTTETNTIEEINEYIALS